MTLKLPEIKEMSVGELKEQYQKSSFELVELRMKFASRQLENVSELRKKKKEIARLLTLQTQRLKEGGVVEEIQEKATKPKAKKETKKEAAKKTEKKPVKKTTKKIKKTKAEKE